MRLPVSRSSVGDRLMIACHCFALDCCSRVRPFWQILLADSFRYADCPQTQSGNIKTTRSHITGAVTSPQVPHVPYVPPVPCAPHLCTPCIPCTPCLDMTPCTPCIPDTPCTPCIPCTPCTPCIPCTSCSQFYCFIENNFIDSFFGLLCLLWHCNDNQSPVNIWVPNMFSNRCIS